MRLTTLFSVAVTGLSGAAIAQVSQQPVEQKLGNDTPAAVQELSTPPAGEEAAPANSTSTPMSNTTDAAPPAGEPTGTTSAPPKG